MGERKWNKTYVRDDTGEEIGFATARWLQYSTPIWVVVSGLNSLPHPERARRIFAGNDNLVVSADGDELMFLGRPGDW